MHNRPGDARRHKVENLSSPAIYCLVLWVARKCSGKSGNFSYQSTRMAETYSDPFYRRTRKGLWAGVGIDKFRHLHRAYVESTPP